MDTAFDTIPAPPDEGIVSAGQLHGVACIVCGGTPPILVPAGHFYTAGREPNSRHGWAVVACPEHAVAA